MDPPAKTGYLVTIFARWSMRYSEPMNFGEGSRTSLTFANTFGWVTELSLSEILTWWPAVLSSMMIPYVLRWEKLLKSSYHIGVSSLLFALRAVPWPWPTLLACQHGVTCFCVSLRTRAFTTEWSEVHVAGNEVKNRYLVSAASQVNDQRECSIRNVVDAVRSTHMNVV